MEVLKSCARTVDRSARSVCYEELGARALAADKATQIESNPDADAQTAASSASGAGTSETASESLPDSIGGGEFVKQQDLEFRGGRGRVTSCQKAADGKWFYVFNNGQVWKQSESGKIQHKDCNFTVTISKDFFGYRMQIDGEKRKIRVNRRK